MGGGERGGGGAGAGGGGGSRGAGEGLRIGPAGEAFAAPDAAGAVVPPPSGLPPGPLRIEASVAVRADRPLTDSADEVRAVLTAAAGERLGLDVAAIDVEVTALLPDPTPGAADPPAPPALPPGTAPDSEPGASVAAAVLAVPGVLSLSGALGGPSRAVEVTDDVIRVQLTIAPDHRALDVARAVSAAIARATSPEPTRVSVLIAEIHAPE